MFINSEPTETVKFQQVSCFYTYRNNKANSMILNIYQLSIRTETLVEPVRADIRYGTDNDYVLTSPPPGFHKLPGWMRNKEDGQIVVPGSFWLI